MMIQITAVINELHNNPEAKIVIASMYEQYFKGLIEFAKQYGYKLVLTIPEKKAEKMYWSTVISIDKEKE